MVLTRAAAPGSQRAILNAVLGLTLLGCLHASPPARLPESTPLTVHVYLEAADAHAVALPRSFMPELEHALADRNLRATPLRGPVDFAVLRTTRARLEAAASGADAAWVLLVEARARFFSQLSGRYRWEVEVRATLTPQDRLGEAQSSDVSVAAFLQFEHETEADALAFVRRQVVDEVLALVDRVLGAPGR